MLKSIFSKQLIVYLAILFASFLILGAVLAQTSRKSFIDTQEEILINTGKEISSLYEQIYISGYLNQLLEVNRLTSEITILYEHLNASFLLLDRNSSVVSGSPDFMDIYNDGLDLHKMPEVYDVLAGKQVTKTLPLEEGTLENSKLVVGYPLTVREEVVGAVFMGSQMPNIRQSNLNIMRASAINKAILFTIASLLIYMSARSFSKPIKEINQTAQIIAGGDFEKRILINTKNNENEIGQLVQNFNHMAETLENHEKTREEFITNVSHDIRSPLTSITGFLEAIMDGTIPKENYDYYLKIVLDECIRLNKVANNLLSVSNIHYLGKNHIQIEKFNINNLIKETVLKFDNVVTNKKIKVNVLENHENTMVFADYVKIQRVVYNLLDNAIKFTNQGGNIVIKTTPQSPKLYISIKDDGEGISLENQVRIFERFYKVDSSRGKDKGGSGLGLFVVKELIKAHNEKIIVNSSLGNGCEFIFTLNLYDNKNKP